MKKHKKDPNIVSIPPLSWGKLRRSTGLVEYVCEHGCGHPDYASAKELAVKYKSSISTWLTHGCCGCCARKDFPGRKPKRLKK